MPEYLAPAVYVEEVSFRAPSIEGVGTTTTGFAGPTLTGPVGDKPELLTSFGAFQNIYGGYDDLSPNNVDMPNYLALSVKGFFDNGGSMLYVSRVFSPLGGSNGFATTGSVADGAVGFTARFPGTLANNQTVTVDLVATKTQSAANLPAGSIVALISNGSLLGTLAAAIGTADTQITITPALSGSTPANVQIDSEIMAVTAVDATKTKLTVTRAVAPAAHSSGASVFASIGSLSANITTAATQLTLAAALTSDAPTLIQIGTEIMAVTAIDGTKTQLTITRAANGTTAATHNANDLVFVPKTNLLYTNAATGTFTNNGTNLSATLPTGSALYALTLRVTAFGAASQAITVPGGSGQPQVLVYDGLGLDSNHPNYIGFTLGQVPPRHIDDLQNQVAVVIGKNVTDAGKMLTALFGTWAGPGSAASKVYMLAKGDDGGEPQSADYDAALQLFEGLEDIAIVAAPGSSAFSQSKAIINSLITHVSRERAYRIAILDTPPNQIASDNEDVRAVIDSSYAALYVPWIVVPNPLARSGTATPAEVNVPPSGYMAGIYARNDEQHSVAKAPANEVVLGALDFERNITFAEQATLNPLGINCLRFFPDRGYRVWGARTASSDSEFMYVNVRRYMIYLEHSIDNSMQWAVFENNGPTLWARVKDSVDSFLQNEFAEGRLLGTAPEQAYFVRCDLTTMTQNDLDNGRMVCLIGVALLKPAEFVIFRIGQKTADARS